MRLSNLRHENINLFMDLLRAFYANKKIKLDFIGTEESEKNQTNFDINFLVNRQFMVVCACGIGEHRYDTFATGFAVGMGAGYVSLDLLLTTEQRARLSMESTKEAIVNNLEVLNDYLFPLINNQNP